MSKRRLFLWALKQYLLANSKPPHLSANVFLRAVVELVDNFIKMQYIEEEQPTAVPSACYEYAQQMSLTARAVSDLVDSM